MKRAETWHRRQALMLASQLPEDVDDAKLIVEEVAELLNSYIVKKPSAVVQASNVLPFGAG